MVASYEKHLAAAEAQSPAAAPETGEDSTTDTRGKEASNLLVLLSELVGVSRDAAMPALPPSSAAARWAELAAFGIAGLVDHALTAVLSAAVVLGVARLAVVALLAGVERRRGRGGEPPLGDPADAAPYAPRGPRRHRPARPNSNVGRHLSSQPPSPPPRLSCPPHHPLSSAGVDKSLLAFVPLMLPPPRHTARCYI